MGFIGYKILEWVLPVVLGPLVYYAAREVLNVADWVDNLPPAFKRIAVTLIGVVITGAFGALHIAVPEACVALTGAATSSADALRACAQTLSTQVPVQGVTAALVAMVIHAIKKQRPNE